MQNFIAVALLFLSCTSCKIIRLDHENFEDYLFADSSPWIVGVSGKVSSKHLEDIYGEVKDRIKIGLIKEKEFVSYLKEKGVQHDKMKLEAIRMYPFGPRVHKAVKWEDTESVEIAVKMAYSSIPDITNRLPNIVDNKNSELRDFIQEAYANMPPKFPVVLFTEKAETPLFYKLIALKFSTLFHFAVIRNPPPATLAVYNVFELPKIVVLLTELLQDGTPRIKPIFYDEKIQGSLSYPNTMRFIYLVHKRYFDELLKNSRRTLVVDLDIDGFFEPHMTQFPELLQPPQEQEGNTDESIRQGIQRKQQSKFSKKGQMPCANVEVCIILVGKDLETSRSEGSWNENVISLTEIKDKALTEGRSFEMYEIDIQCNEEMELEFDIYTGDTPVVLVLRPKNQLYTIGIVEELPMALGEFLEKALLGKIHHWKYKVLPKFHTGNCTEKNSKEDDKNLNVKHEL